MFKKKKQEEKKQCDYTKWQEDLGFLQLILSRKKGITKEFIIHTYSSQKNNTGYLKDDEIEPIVENTVNDVLTAIGDNYRNFLIDKYFGTDKAFINYVTEDVYVDLVSDSINANQKKIQALTENNLVRSLNSKFTRQKDKNKK